MTAALHGPYTLQALELPPRVSGAKGEVVATCV